MYSLEAFGCVLFIALGAGILADQAVSGRQADETAVKRSKLLLCAAFSLCFLWPVLHIGMYLIAPGHAFLLGTWGTGPVFQCLFNDLAFISGTLLAVLHYRLGSEHKPSDRVFLGLTVFGLAVLLLLSNLFCLFWDNGDCNHSFTSPDGAHTIVVHERSVLLAGSVSVYERVHPLVVRLWASEITDDGYKPIEAGDYAVTWHTDSVTVSFGDGAGEQKSCTLSFAPEA